MTDGNKGLSEGTLFVVATPIGNLGDLSPRARDVLAAVDLIAAEDTRLTGRLLSHFGIRKRRIALHEHNEDDAAVTVIRALQEGKDVALVSDAGTPLISDPGYGLLRAAHAAGLTVTAIPGPCAFVAALSASGLPTDRFVFEGFLPQKAAARKKRLLLLATEERTLVFYEAVHRIADTINDMIEILGGARSACISRELTKLHEQNVSADLAHLAAALADGRMPAKGEFVIVVAGMPAAVASKADPGTEMLLRELLGVLPGKQAVDIVARLSGANRNALYQKMLELKNGTKEQ